VVGPRTHPSGAPMATHSGSSGPWTPHIKHTGVNFHSLQKMHQFTSKFIMRFTFYRFLYKLTILSWINLTWNLLKNVLFFQTQWYIYICNIGPGRAKILVVEKATKVDWKSIFENQTSYVIDNFQHPTRMFYWFLYKLTLLSSINLSWNLFKINLFYQNQWYKYICNIGPGRAKILVVEKATKVDWKSIFENQTSFVIDNFQHPTRAMQKKHFYTCKLKL